MPNDVGYHGLLKRGMNKRIRDAFAACATPDMFGLLSMFDDTLAEVTEKSVRHAFVDSCIFPYARLPERYTDAAISAREKHNCRITDEDLAIECTPPDFPPMYRQQKSFTSSAKSEITLDVLEDSLEPVDETSVREEPREPVVRVTLETWESRADVSTSVSSEGSVVTVGPPSVKKTQRQWTETRSEALKSMSIASRVRKVPVTLTESAAQDSELVQQWKKLSEM